VPSWRVRTHVAFGMGDSEVRKFMNRLAILSMIGLPIAAVAATVPAGASTGGVHFRVTEVYGPQPATTPNSNIVGNGKKAVYDPDAQKAKEDTSGNDCSTGFISNEITNTGTKNAYVTLGGTTFFTAPAGSEWDICTYGGTKGDQNIFGLSNAGDTKNYAATLVITFKD
jgi:hypothetical protein